MRLSANRLRSLPPMFPNSPTRSATSLFHDPLAQTGKILRRLVGMFVEPDSFKCADGLRAFLILSNSEQDCRAHLHGFQVAKNVPSVVVTRGMVGA